MKDSSFLRVEFLQMVLKGLIMNDLEVKQKELELKEKELRLRELELELREREQKLKRETVKKEEDLRLRTMEVEIQEREQELIKQSQSKESFRDLNMSEKVMTLLGAAGAGYVAMGLTGFSCVQSGFGDEFTALICVVGIVTLILVFKKLVQYFCRK